MLPTSPGAVSAASLLLLPALAAGGAVGVFDDEAMAAVMAGAEPAFVKFDFPPCGICEALDGFWDKLGDLYPSVLYRADCTADPAVCHARSVREPAGPSSDRQPVFKFWTGSSWRRYSGVMEPRPIMEYMQRKLTDEQSQALSAAAQARAEDQAAQVAQQAATTAQAQRMYQEKQREAQEQQRRRQEAPAYARDESQVPEDGLHWQTRVLLGILAVFFLGVGLLVRWLGGDAVEQPGTFVLVGTYTQKLGHVDGRGDGLYLFRLHEADGTLTPVSCIGVGVPNLSYLCAEPPRAPLKDGWPGAYVVHAASEAAPEGSILSLQWDPRQAPCLKVMDHIAAGGGQTCHVALLDPPPPAAAGRRRKRAPPPSPLVLAANYADGTVAVLSAAADAKGRRTLSMKRDAVLRPPTDKGSLANPARQESPHAHHCEAVRPPGAPSDLVLLTDLGTDSVSLYAPAPEPGSAAPLRLLGAFAAPPGSGPRHVAAHPSGAHAYCACELDCHVLVLALRRDAAPTQLQRVPLLDARTPAGGGAAPKAAPKGGKQKASPAGKKAGGAASGGKGAPATDGAADGDAAALRPTAATPSASAIRVSRDGRFVYVALRGADEIATLRVEKGGERLVLVGRTACGDAGDLSTGGEGGEVWAQHTPRDIVLAGAREEVLLVANQDSHCVVVFGRDAETGALARLGAAETPSPCALLPLVWPPPTA